MSRNFFIKQCYFKRYYGRIYFMRTTIVVHKLSSGEIYLQFTFFLKKSQQHVCFSFQFFEKRKNVRIKISYGILVELHAFTPENSERHFIFHLCRCRNIHIRKQPFLTK